CAASVQQTNSNNTPQKDEHFPFVLIVCTCSFLLLNVVYCCRPRFISDKNQVRRSVSSIQTSIRLAVAMSRCSSQTLCASRRRPANVLLSSANSAIMSDGSTYSALLSSTR